jgi:tetratricopeptide (TPR) repeat protein
MPQDIPFTWSEDENMLYFVLQVRGAKQKGVDVALCDVYVKINCRPQLFSVDLKHEVEPEHKATMCKIGGNKISLSLRKKRPGLWLDFRATGSKEELKVRRAAALAASAERETERLKMREDKKHEMIKAAEHEQWRLDRENREQIETWEQDEKKRWEDELLSGFDEMGKLQEAENNAPPVNDEDMDLPDMEESVTAPKPKEVKFKTEVNPEKIHQFSEKELPQVCEVTDEEAAAIRSKKSEDKDAIWSEKDLQKDVNKDKTNPVNNNEDYEDYNVEVRENPGKIGMRFSVRPRPGVPVRDRGQQEPPRPKNMVKSDLPPMLAGDRDQDEEDPVWLKDKADNLMVAGDYQGAYNAYTEALKLGIHPNAFANRSVADMYLGNLEQCVEDCNRAIAIIDKRNAPHPGCPSGACDPQEQVVRTRCEIRIGTAFLWLGAFKKAEDHFQKALDSEGGLQLEERKQLKEDLARVQKSRSALILKEKADCASRRAHGTDELVQKELGVALEAYNEAAEADSENAVVYANRCIAHLRAGHLEQCVADADKALSC